MKDADKPSYREMRVLQALCLGTVEDATHFQPGVGDRTLAGMVAKGWIEPACDETYGTDGYRWTPAGQEAWRESSI